MKQETKYYRECDPNKNPPQKSGEYLTTSGWAHYDSENRDWLISTSNCLHKGSADGLGIGYWFEEYNPPESIEKLKLELNT